MTPSDSLLSPDSRLADLQLPFIDALLTEKFLLPTESLIRFNIKPPETLQDISDLSGIAVDQVLSTIRKCVEIDQLIWIDGILDEYAGLDNVWIMDMRPGIAPEDEPLHKNARIFHHGNQSVQVELMRTLSKVIVLNSSKEKAWSSTMALRELGINSFVIK
jgi:hypothetical protein